MACEEGAEPRFDTTDDSVPGVVELQSVRGVVEFW
jgi:hypothetical protein